MEKASRFWVSTFCSSIQVNTRCIFHYIYPARPGRAQGAMPCLDDCLSTSLQAWNPSTGDFGPRLGIPPWRTWRCPVSAWPPGFISKRLWTGLPHQPAALEHTLFRHSAWTSLDSPGAGTASDFGIHFCGSPWCPLTCRARWRKPSFIAAGLRVRASLRPRLHPILCLVRPVPSRNMNGCPRSPLSI
jgi:hypothetical protein